MDRESKVSRVPKSSSPLHLARAPLEGPPSAPPLNSMLPVFLSSSQLKISFSETALETTYQYPSESSVLEELGPEPETPSTPIPPVAQPDDEEDEDEEELLLLQRELQGGLRTKALIVGELRLCWSEGTPWCSYRALRSRREGEELMLVLLERDLV